MLIIASRVFPPAPAPPSPARQPIPEAAEERDEMAESTILGLGKATKPQNGSGKEDWEEVSGAEEEEEADKVDLIEDFAVVERAKKA